MGRPLDNISISGFKSIHSLEDFDLKKLNILIGANGAGKAILLIFSECSALCLKKDSPIL